MIRCTPLSSDNSCISQYALISVCWYPGHYVMEVLNDWCSYYVHIATVINMGWEIIFVQFCKLCVRVAFS